MSKSKASHLECYETIDGVLATVVEVNSENTEDIRHFHHMSTFLLDLIFSHISI
jgi:hypothetical protein